ncbi:MAG: TetR/AcrR family transcriptional regulator [Burkholderiales bacterium]|nr:TetR/AcrR family transcriptional regulator [Burkholderiales bacterium]
MTRPPRHPGGEGHARQPRAATPRTRDRAATEERILGAVGEVLARDGFGGIGVNAIAKQAAVDKVLIYRYFGGLPELLRAWGESGRFWPRVADLLGPDPQALLSLPTAERYARFFEHFVDALRARPLTLAVLAGEVNERNELTALLEAEREQWGAEATRVLGGAEWSERPWLQGVTLLLVAGVQHLLLRSRQIRVFGGVDLRSDESWAALKHALRELAWVLFPAPPAPAPRPPRASRRR